MSSRPVRVGFAMIPRRLWAGGYNYMLNLFAALHRHRPGEIVPIVFYGQADDVADLDDFKANGVELVPSRAWYRRNIGVAEALLLGIDRRAAAEFRASQIDVVFENARFFGWRLRYPAVAWFPDMQHLRLPHLFSQAARWRRELGFRAQIASRRLIMLSSESALSDCERFYPGVSSRTAVVRFATQPSPALLKDDPADVASQYDLKPGYFYLPNQFWPHKNHRVVIDALAMLAKRDCDAVVAASGAVDPRNPGYLDDILRQVRAWGLETRFRYLGMIPQPHVYALLRGARALLNPSRFEGWSTTIEEAKAFGVPMILSELDVHREQTDGNALYFAPDDAGTLADRLASIAQTSLPSGVRGLTPNLDQRVARFAEDFVSVIRRASRMDAAFAAPERPERPQGGSQVS